MKFVLVTYSQAIVTPPKVFHVSAHAAVKFVLVTYSQEYSVSSNLCVTSDSGVSNTLLTINFKVPFEVLHVL